jgi:transcriptional regulator with XRE-family HTH domain
MEAQIRVAGGELRGARELSGLSRREVSEATGVPESAVRRLELGQLREVSMERLALVADAVGLEPSLRLYPTGAPMRDAAHLALLERLRGRLHPSFRWRAEVPLPGANELRAWDGGVWLGRDWVPVEAETRIGDLQALERRTNLKMRDGGVQSVILLVADTRNNRAAIRSASAAWLSAFPIATRLALRELAGGRLPEASALIVL